MTICDRLVKTFNHFSDCGNIDKRSGLLPNVEDNIRKNIIK